MIVQKGDMIYRPDLIPGREYVGVTAHHYPSKNEMIEKKRSKQTYVTVQRMGCTFYVGLCSSYC